MSCCSMTISSFSPSFIPELVHCTSVESNRKHLHKCLVKMKTAASVSVFSMIRAPCEKSSHLIATQSACIWEKPCLHWSSWCGNARFSYQKSPKREDLCHLVTRLPAVAATACSGHMNRTTADFEVLKNARKKFCEEVSFRRKDRDVSLAKAMLLIGAEDEAFISFNRDMDARAVLNEGREAVNSSNISFEWANIDALPLAGKSIAAWLSELDVIAKQVKAELVSKEIGCHLVQVLEAVNAVIFDLRGFTRSSFLKDPKQSYLHSVLTSKSGTADKLSSQKCGSGSRYGYDNSQNSRIWRNSKIRVSKKYIYIQNYKYIHDTFEITNIHCRFFLFPCVFKIFFLIKNNRKNKQVTCGPYLPGIFLDVPEYSGYGLCRPGYVFFSGYSQDIARPYPHSRGLSSTVCRRLGVTIVGAPVGEDFLIWPQTENTEELFKLSEGESWFARVNGSCVKHPGSKAFDLNSRSLTNLEVGSNRDIVAIALANLKRLHWKRASKAHPGLLLTSPLRPVHHTSEKHSNVDTSNILMLRPQDLRLSTMASERLLILQPHNWALRRDHGMLLYHSRRYGEAVQELSICMAFAPVEEAEILEPFVEKLHLMRLESSWKSVKTSSSLTPRP